MPQKSVYIPKLEYEKSLIASGKTCLAGVDEAGRGPLAGPVVAACVCLDVAAPVKGVTDSKLLSPKVREELFEKIIDAAREVKVSIISREVIDEINILNATKRAMTQCISQMSAPLSCVLIDAVKLPDIKVETLPLIHGDMLSYLIGAASIVAKVTRDRLMQNYALEFPQYKFENNKGYATKEHILRLKKYGACQIHRRSFLKNFEQMLAEVGAE